MKHYKISYIIISLLLLFLFSSCNYDNPLDTEQYKKVIYMIGASDNVLTKEIKYSGEKQEIFVSVGISGSLLIDNDISVNLSSQNSVIDWYNKKFKYLETDIKYQELSDAFYNLPSYSTTLRAGETYARLPIQITSEGMHCDSLYALTFKIDSASDYEINQKDSALIVSFNLVNTYSGSYIFKGFRHTLNASGSITSSASVNVLRTFKATNENTVRFFSEQQSETTANISNYAITLKIDSNNQITVAAWENFDIEDATCTYDKTTEVFTIDYRYHLNGEYYQMEGTFTSQKNNSKRN